MTRECGAVGISEDLERTRLHFVHGAREQCTRPVSTEIATLLVGGNTWLHDAHDGKIVTGNIDVHRLRLLGLLAAAAKCPARPTQKQS
jgi:hypothetical protein